MDTVVLKRQCHDILNLLLLTALLRDLVELDWRNKIISWHCPFMVSNMTVNFTPKGIKPNLSTTNICSLEKCGYCTCSSSYCIPLQICIRTSYEQNNLDLKNYSFRKEEKMLTPTSQIFYQCRRASMHGKELL